MVEVNSYDSFVEDKTYHLTFSCSSCRSANLKRVVDIQMFDPYDEKKGLWMKCDACGFFTRKIDMDVLTSAYFHILAQRNTDILCAESYIKEIGRLNAAQKFSDSTSKR